MAITRVKGRPITASRPMKMGRPVLSTSNTSSDAQKMISRPSAPFNNPQYFPLSVPTHPAYKAAKNFAKDYVHPAKPAKFDATAVGYPAKGYFSEAGRNSINSGFPLSGNKRKAGRVSTNVGPGVSAKEMKRVRQNYPGLGIGKWRP